MADTKISQLPVASNTSGSDLYTLVQGGVNKSVTFAVLQASLGVNTGITQLTGDIVAGPGSGSQAASLVATSNSTLVTLSALALPWSQLIGSPPTFNQNTTGTAYNITATSNSSLTSLPNLEVNYTQLIGSPPTWNQSTTGNAATATYANTAGVAATATDVPYSALTGTVPTWNQNTTGTASNITATSNSTLTTLSSLSLPYSQLTGTVPTWNQDTTGNAATATYATTAGIATNITASSNSTLTSLPNLGLPYSQLTGTVPTWNQNTTGNAATATVAGNITATSNSTLTTLSSLALPFSQLTGQATLSQLPTIASNTILGNNTGGAAAPIELTTAQVNAILPVFTGLLNGLVPASGGGTTTFLRADGTWDVAGTGSVTSVSVVSANGFAGSVANPTTAAAITISTSVTGILYGNGTSIAAAVAGNFPTLNQDTTGVAANITATTNSTLTSLPNLAVNYTQLTGTVPTWNQNTTGTAANVTATSNSTLTTLSSLALPYSQLSGTVPTWNQNTTGTAANITATSNSTLTSLPNLAVNYTQLTGTVPTWNQNTTGTASNITATSNSTLTTLSSLALPYSQLTGAPVVSGFTQGSVIFANSGGNLSQDNANLFWNDTAFALGIGTNTPQAASQITMVNSTGTSKPLWMFNYGTGSTTGIRGDAARGTAVSPSASQAGDTLNFMSGRGYGTSQFAASSTGSITIKAGGAFTNSSMPTYITFNVTNSGASTSTAAMTLNYTGSLLLGTTTDNGLDLLQLASGKGIAANYLKFYGTSSGYVELIAPPTIATSYSMALPTAQGAASSYLQNDGAGNLSWTTGTPPVVTQNIDGGSSFTLYTTPQIITGGTP